MIKTYFLDRDKLMAALNERVIMDGHELVDNARKALAADAYTHVATFTNFHDGDDLDYVWLASNNDNGQTESWSRQPMYPEYTEIVAPLPIHNGKTYGHRSMCVGDICELANGDKFVVAAFGFSKL